MSKVEIDVKLVQHVAKLAQLKLTDQEQHYYVTQLNKIVGYVDQLGKIKINPSDVQQILESTPERSDEVVRQNVLERALSQAPQRIGSAFQVPRILD